MYWVDKIADEITEKYKDKISKKETLIVRDEKTASGRVHVGSLRGVVIHGLVDEVLRERGISSKFLYEINDFDVMDGLPTYLDQEKFRPHMGKLLCEVPSPDGMAANYAEYFANEFIGVIKEAGFEPEFYRSSEVYKSGRYNEAIKLVLENADKIREIYKRVSGSVKEGKWLPISVRCENCAKIGTTLATEFDGEKVTYTCRDVEWAKGCGHTGKISPFDGNAKIPWKVEWAAKFKVIGVDVEGGGKDHCTKGGARDVADTIAREIFKWEPPFNIPYEFIQVGGKKMSSSKGAGSSAREVADLLPPEMVRLLQLQREPQRTVDFIPDGDTLPILFDLYDKYAHEYVVAPETDWARAFKLIHPENMRADLGEFHIPRFSQVAFLSQMHHLDIEKEAEHLVGQPLTEKDKKELARRIKYANIWIKTYAPEDYKFEIQETLPEAAKNLSEIQKKALGEVLAYVEKTEPGAGGTFDGQAMHSELHAIKERLAIEPKQFFEAIYLSILGKTSGPKAGWFLSVMDKNFLIKRLSEATV